MCIADYFFPQKCQAVSHSILYPATRFSNHWPPLSNHCCSCHQWRSRTESLPGCLPMCLLNARKFLSGLHPTYHLGMKKMIIRHALGKPPLESSVHARAQRAGEGDAQIRRARGQEFHGSVWQHSWQNCTSAHWFGLWWHRENSRARALWLSPRLSQTSSLPSQSLEQQFQVSPQRSLLRATGYPLRWKSVSWLGIDATTPFS